MKSLNKVCLLGNLGSDPEVRYTQSGDAVCSITIATSESWKDKNTGEAKEKTEWHKVVAFRRLAEIMGEYLKKGSKVYIEGQLRTRKWQDNQGQDRYTTEINARDMLMLGDSGGGKSAGAATKPSNQTRQAPAHNAKQSSQSDDGFFDDDIPF